MTSLTLINDHWLGAATPKNYAPAVAALADLLNPVNAVRFPYTALPSQPNRAHGIDYSNEILHHIETATTLLNREQPDRLLNLACDCGSEFAPIAYLLSRYRDSMTVFWFDAHADLNTPGTSPSGHFHGMVLRALTGHESFDFSPNHPLSPKQVVLLGARDLDPAERDYIEAERIRLIPPTQVAELCWLPQGVTRAYVHIDFDVLDPNEFPWVGCPTRAGISLASLRQALQHLHDHSEIVGLSAVEISANGDNAAAAASIARDLLHYFL